MLNRYRLLAIVLISVIATFCEARAQTRPVVALSAGHGDYVRAVVFANDGSWLASGGNDRTIKIWETRTGRLLRTLVGHKSYVTSVALLPDGKRLVSCGHDEEDDIRIWNVETGELLGRWKANGKPIRIAVAPDGSVVRTAATSVDRWQAETGRELERSAATGLKEASTSVLAPDGRLLAVGHEADGKSADISLWNAESASLLRTLPRRHARNIRALAFSRDGKFLASTAGKDGILIWNVASGAVQQSIQGDIDIEGLQFSLDGSEIIAVSTTRGNGKIGIWEVGSGRLLRSVDQDDASHRSIILSSDGTRFAAFGGNTLVLNDAKTGAPVLSMRGTGEGFGIELRSGPGGKLFAHLDSQAAFLDPALGQVVDMQNVGQGEPARTIAIDGAGRWLLPLMSGPDVVLWDATNARVFKTLRIGKSADDTIDRAAISPDARWVVIREEGGGDGVQVWDVASGKLVRKIGKGERSSGVMSLAFSVDSKHFALGIQKFAPSKKPTISIVEVATGRQIRSTGSTDDSEGTWALAFSRDGKSIYGAQMGDGVSSYDLGTGRQQWHWKDESDTAFHLQRSPDGRLLLIPVGQKVFAVEAATGRTSRVLTNTFGVAQSLVVTDDGRRVVAGNGNRTLAIWDVQTGDLLATIVFGNIRNREWATVTPEGFFAASENGEQLLHIVDGLTSTDIASHRRLLHRPDLVREKLAGDPAGRVRAAVTEVDRALAAR